MIEIHGISKSFATPAGRRWVFRDLSLLIPAQRSVALIGRNGAGKSTLLRVIGGLEKPSSGRIVRHGRVSWPVGLSGGFQGSLSGRDNAKFICRLYGAPDEVNARVAEVERFCELGDYFDMPIRTYSSGMRARLGFGLSIAFDFDWYLVDEVTAVGDASFRAKADAALAAKRERAGFVMVSHNLNTLQKQCDMAVLLGNGQARVFDDIAECIRVHRNELESPAAA